MAQAPYFTEAIANYFLAMAKKHGEPLTAMKLQKLVFYAHGWHLGLYDEPLLNELAEAWEFGPVFPSLYHEFKRFGSDSIEAQATCFIGNALTKQAPELPNDKGHEDDRAFLDRVWEIYGKYTAAHLSQKTHLPDSPWSKTVEGYEQGHLPRNLNISNDLIKEYFKEQAV